MFGGHCEGPGQEPDLAFPTPKEKVWRDSESFVCPPFWKESAPSGWPGAKTEAHERVERSASSHLPAWGTFSLDSPSQPVSSWAWLPAQCLSLWSKWSHLFSAWVVWASWVLG